MSAACIPLLFTNAGTVANARLHRQAAQHQTFIDEKFLELVSVGDVDLRKNAPLRSFDNLVRQDLVDVKPARSESRELQANTIVQPCRGGRDVRLIPQGEIVTIKRDLFLCAVGIERLHAGIEQTDAAVVAELRDAAFEVGHIVIGIVVQHGRLDFEAGRCV